MHAMQSAATQLLGPEAWHTLPEPFGLHLTVAPERSMSKCTSREGTLASAGSVSSAGRQPVSWQGAAQQAGMRCMQVQADIACRACSFNSK